MKAKTHKRILAAGFMLLFSTALLAQPKFDHAEYMKPKTEDQKKDDHPVKGSIAIDRDKKTVEFVDEKGASVISIPDDKIKSMLYEKTS